MDYNPSHGSIGDNLQKIIRVMRNIGFTTAPYSTTITPEKLGAAMEQMDHECPNICSVVSNGLFIYIDRAHPLLFSGHIHGYCQNTSIKDRLKRFP